MEIKVRVNKRDLRRLLKLDDEFKEGFYKGMRKAMRYVEGKSKKQFGKAGELQVGTGYLRRSIQSGVDRRGNNIIGWLGSNVRYAAIHEFGGIIKPRTEEYLRFQIGGKWKTVKEVVIPERSFLRKPIQDNMRNILTIVERDILKEMNT